MSPLSFFFSPPLKFPLTLLHSLSSLPPPSLCSSVSATYSPFWAFISSQFHILSHSPTLTPVPYVARTSQILWLVQKSLQPGIQPQIILLCLSPHIFSTWHPNQLVFFFFYCLFVLFFNHSFYHYSNPALLKMWSLEYQHPHSLEIVKNGNYWASYQT